MKATNRSRSVGGTLEKTKNTQNEKSITIIYNNFMSDTKLHGLDTKNNYNLVVKITMYMYTMSLKPLRA